MSNITLNIWSPMDGSWDSSQWISARKFVCHGDKCSLWSVLTDPGEHCSHSVELWVLKPSRLWLQPTLRSVPRSTLMLIAYAGNVGYCGECSRISCLYLCILWMIMLMCIYGCMCCCMALCMHCEKMETVLLVPTNAICMSPTSLYMCIYDRQLMYAYTATALLLLLLLTTTTDQQSTYLLLLNHLLLNHLLLIHMLLLLLNQLSPWSQ